MHLRPLFPLLSVLLAASMLSAQSAETAALAPLANSPETTDAAQTAAPSSAQAAPQPSAQVICGITHLLRCVQDLGEDDRGILTSPLRLKPRDAEWIAPLGAATGLALAYDADAQQQLGVDTSRMNTASNISMMGEFWIAGGESASIYFLGLARKNPHLAETGRLATEAILDSGTVTAGLKIATNRERPYQGNGNGNFWTTPSTGWSWDSSFPSGHATASMALARVVAGEYPRWYVASTAYAFAETVSICRVLARDHFPSDVLVGQSIGFLTGNYVLNHRALYRPGKSGAVARILSTATPIVDPATHTTGLALSIPVGR